MGDEILLGGTIYNNPFLLITLFPFMFKKYIRQKQMYIYTLIAPIAAIVVMIVDANMAGVIMRYNADYSWYLMLSFVIILCSVIVMLKEREKVQTWIYYLCLIFFTAYVIRGFLFLFAGEGRPKDNI